MLGDGFDDFMESERLRHLPRREVAILGYGWVEIRRRLRQRLGHNGSETLDKEKLASSLGETNSWSVLGVEHFSGLNLATVTY